MDYSWKSYKAQNLSKKNCQEVKSQEGETKTRKVEKVAYNTYSYSTH